MLKEHYVRAWWLMLHWHKQIYKVSCSQQSTSALDNVLLVTFCQNVEQDLLISTVSTTCIHKSEVFDIKTWVHHYHESASSNKSRWKNNRYKPGCTRHSQSFSCVLWSWRTLTEPGRKTPAETCKTDRTVVNHTNDLMECWELLSHEISKFMNKLQLTGFIFKSYSLTICFGQSSRYIFMKDT